MYLLDYIFVLYFILVSLHFIFLSLFKDRQSSNNQMHWADTHHITLPSVHWTRKAILKSYFLLAYYFIHQYININSTNLLTRFGKIQMRVPVHRCQSDCIMQKPKPDVNC